MIMYALFFKRVMTVVVGTIIVLTGCVTQKTQSTSVQNAVYILEAVKDMPTGGVFSFRDYCAFKAERGGPDSDLDRTLADANARMELHFAVGTAELTLVSSSGDTIAAFL
jgi:hypothetical protein